MTATTADQVRARTPRELAVAAEALDLARADRFAWQAAHPSADVNPGDLETLVINGHAETTRRPLTGSTVQHDADAAARCGAAVAVVRGEFNPVYRVWALVSSAVTA